MGERAGEFDGHDRSRSQEGGRNERKGREEKGRGGKEGEGARRGHGRGGRVGEWGGRGPWALERAKRGRAGTYSYEREGREGKKGLGLEEEERGSFIGETGAGVRK